MLGGGASPDDDVIQVDKKKSSPARRRSICRWKAFLALRGPKVIRKSSNSLKVVAMLLNVSRVHQYLMVALPQVHLAEGGAASYAL
jgi:hypothetical protein